MNETDLLNALGPLADLYQDETVQEIIVDGPERVYLERSREFEDCGINFETPEALTSLIERDGEPLLVKLPRTSGRKDSEYMHLFCGPVDVKAYASQPRVERQTSPARTNVADLEARVARLEAELASIKDQLGIEDDPET